MLKEEQMRVAYIKSEFWGKPLYAAVLMGHRDLARELLHRGADVNVVRPSADKSPLEAAIANKDEETIRLLIEPRYGITTSSSAFETALVKSLDTNQPRIAHLLFERLENKLSDSRYILSEGLRAACRQGMIEVVQLLLNHGGDVNEHFHPDRTAFAPSLVEQAAWTGQEEVLRFLLARGANPYGRDSTCFSMCAAAWGGHVGAVRILLDAGVQLEPTKWVSVLEIAAPSVGSAGLAQILLDSGNFEVNKLDDDPKMAEVYVVEFMVLACQQGNLGFVQGLAQHGVTIDDESFYARYELPPPIIIATAFRQHYVVRALRELGATEIDPLDSIIREDFVKGKYPRDPPAPPECRMPWQA